MLHDYTARRYAGIQGRDGVEMGSYLRNVGDKESGFSAFERALVNQRTW